jgi:hypothetical protein
VQHPAGAKYKQRLFPIVTAVTTWQYFLAEAELTSFACIAGAVSALILVDEDTVLHLRMIEKIVS